MSVFNSDVMLKTPKIFFTADTHFGAQRTLELSKRPFSSVKEMDEVIVNNWNSIVGLNDAIYHLGDFGNYDILPNLNGRIKLILGNYEVEEMNKQINDSIIENGNEYCNILETIGFERVSDETNIKFEGIDDIFHLCHEPEKHHEDKFNLFGHIHRLCMVKRYGLNVGTDCHFFKPISMDEVLFYKNAIEKFYDNNVFD
jgi:calcineurin-like phosphoesterase family protein